MQQTSRDLMIKFGVSIASRGHPLQNGFHHSLVKHIRLVLYPWRILLTKSYSKALGPTLVCK
jgi:hypothetical protein